MNSAETLLRTRAPYDASGMLDFLTAHAVPGRDLVRGVGQNESLASSHALDVPGGTALAHLDWAGLCEEGDEVLLQVRFELPLATDLEAATAALRRVLDFDADPSEIASTLGSDAKLGALVARRPGLRMPGARNPQEFALGTVLGQQVSLAAARTLQGRLASQFACDEPDGAVATAGFVSAPDVARIAATDAAELRERIGLTMARAETLRTLATALADGLDVGPAADHAVTRAQLLALRGIGPWTVEIIAMRAMRDVDAYPAGDLILRRVLGSRTDRETRALADGWRPFRGYATQHLWADFLAGAP